MHGEPTLNPNWLEIVELFRKILPNNQIMMTSNGGGIVSSKNIQNTIKTFFKNGGTILALDEYINVNLVNKIKASYDEFELDDLGVTVYQYPENKDGNPHQRTTKNKKKLTFISPIDVSTTGTHHSLNNHCGSGGKLDDSQVNKRCAKPFREMSFNWDGSVNLCCNDFIGEYHCGTIYNESIDILWNNKYFNSARKFLMLADRSKLRPCRGCNAKSYRTGLLPDKKGQDSLYEPTDSDSEIVLQALEGGPDRTPTNKAIVNITSILTEDELFNWDIK